MFENLHTQKMKPYTYLLIILIQLSFCQAVKGNKRQNSIQKIEVTDSETKEPLVGASILYYGAGASQKGTLSNAEGVAYLQGESHSCTVIISYIGYKTYKGTIQLGKKKLIRIRLTPDHTILQEVVVTASESKGMTSSSKIDTQAMSHLQPSSFTDLLSLLPGGLSSNPQMGSVNTIRMREAGGLGKNYDFSSLGTAFIVDDVPIATDANLQSVPGSTSAHTGRDITSKGVDMRTLSTDNIESVEVIRGIPSVRYGDVSTGVVKIKQKEHATPLEFRFKADQFSKLFYTGKGVNINHNHLLNLHIDYMDSKIDPRNRLENFKRITSSARLQGRYKVGQKGKLMWNSSVNFSGTFDHVKTDPEVSEKHDRYKNTNRRVAINNKLRYITGFSKGLRNISLTPSISAQFDKVEQTREIFLTMPSAIPNSKENGSFDAIYLPSHYISDLVIEGKPINAYLQLSSQWAFNLAKSKHLVDLGGEFRYDKNKGRGQIYDVALPPSPSMSTRPRTYREIPALKKLSFFLEDNIILPLTEKKQVEIEAGVRGIQLTGQDKSYDINNKMYLDPRINAMVDVVHTQLADANFRWRIGGGWGILTKTPTLAQLYPDKIYYDLEELNYYHNNPNYRRLVLRTHIYEKKSSNLKANRNQKAEIRSDFSWKGYRLSTTYFHEKSNSGFRDQSGYLILPYRKYDTTGIDPSAIKEKPQLESLPFSEEVYMAQASYIGNGSKLQKQGVEFQFNTPRFKKINTRITFNGAWFKTEYNDNTEDWKNSSIVYEGKQLPYMGRYRWNDRSVFQTLNTSLMFDTYLPLLGLTFSTTMQNRWINKAVYYAKNNIPFEYIDREGVIRPYTEKEAEHPKLQWLVLRESSSSRSSVPHAMTINFKANKNIGEHMNLSLFVNKIWSYTPSYSRNGIRIHRSTSPYFGMEMNLKF